MQHASPNYKKNDSPKKTEQPSVTGRVLTDNRPQKTTQLVSNGSFTNSPNPIQFTLVDRLKSGFSYTSVAAGALTGLALYSNPIGWSILAAGAGGALATAGVSYLKGSDDVAPKQVVNPDDKDKAKKVVKPVVPKRDMEEEWKKSQEDRVLYEDALLKLNHQLDKATRNLRIELRTAYRKLADLEPLMAHISTLKTVELNTWRGEYTTEHLRTAINRNRQAQTAYSKFVQLIEEFDDIPTYQHLTRKEFNRYSSLEEVVSNRRKDYEEREQAAIRIEKAIPQTDDFLSRELGDEIEISKLSKVQVALPVAAQAPHLAAPMANVWFGTTYPNGWVHLQGNSYAAITAAGATAAPHGSLVMFQDALQNGTISDYGTGASGVKWAKNELKVRRTRLESIAVAGDTRLSGAKRIVSSAVTGLATDIQVLEFTTSISAH